LQQQGIRLHALLTWHDVLAVLPELDSFSQQQQETLAHYLSDPIGWSATHGGRGA
jgi:orotate phosphoribosyltransferase